MAVSEFSTYDSGGQLVHTGVSGDINAQVFGISVGVLPTKVDDINDWYIPDINTPVLTSKLLLTSSSSVDTLSIVSDGVSASTFGTSLPNGTNVSITTESQNTSQTNESIVVNDGTFVLTSTIAADFNIIVDVFPYKQYEYTITAT